MKKLTKTQSVSAHKKYTSPLSQTLLFSAACALLLLPGARPASAQSLNDFQSLDAAPQAAAPAADAVDFVYVSPQGSDSYSGQTPTVSAGSGPFQTMAHAQEAVNALLGSGLTRPVEVVLDPSVCPAQDSLTHWFSAAPTGSVIWHSDSSRTVLIYTPTMAEQIDALGAEDFANGPGGRTARFYVSPSGSDAWSGLLPGPCTSSAEKADNAEKTDGPFQTLAHAQEAVNAFQAANPGAAVEVVLEDAGAFSRAAAPARSAADKPAKTPANHTASGRNAQKSLAVYNGAKLAIIKTTTLKTGVLANSTALLQNAGNQRLVFAHYICCPDYGNSVAARERDIQDAQAAGIDGFAINVGSWDSAGYKQFTAQLFQAAAALNSGFKLFFSADMTGVTYPEVVEMMTAYANNPYYWHVQQTSGSSIVSRPVLSTWGGEGGAYADVRSRWQAGVLDPLRAAGINVYFMPAFFLTTPQGSYFVDISPATQAAQVNGLLTGLTDGDFNVGSVGVPTDPARVTLSQAENNASLMKAAGLGTMGSVTPQYWGSRQVSAGRRYMEYDGGEGLAAQWNSIINVQKPDWVEMFTWNDFDEATYMSPIDDISKYFPYLQVPALDYYKCHAGALKLNQYFVNWYKSGAKPAIQNDSLYYFYRTTPKAAVASNDPLGPVTWFLGDCSDVIFVTTLLTAPATLSVTTGSQTLTYPVPAGLSHTRVPFQVGAQSFQLIRQGQTVLSQAGEPVIANPVCYDFNYYTGAVTGQAATHAQP